MNEFTKDINRDFGDDETNDHETPGVDFCTVCLLDLDECICNVPTPDETFIRYAEIGTDELPF